MKTYKVSKYQIDSYDDNGKLFVKIYNLNAKKDYNRQIAYYRFSDDKSREDYITSFIEDQRQLEKYKLDRKEARKRVVNGYKVGDIVYNSWGYDQTNIDFYQVVKVSPKSVYIRQIGSAFTSKESGNSMAGYVVPVKDKFLADSKVYRASIREAGVVSSLGHSATQWLSPYTGGDLYCSWYA